MALPDPISAAKNRADAVPFSTAQSILWRRVDTEGAAEDESSTSASGESNNDTDAVDQNYPELGRGRRGDTQGAESDESSTSAFGEANYTRTPSTQSIRSQDDAGGKANP